MTENSSLRRSGLAVALALVALLLVGGVAPTSASSVASQTAQAESAQVEPGQVSAAWTRTLEPVVISGAVLPLFNGVALDDLFVYAYNGGIWQEIPFQFDEVDASGTYTPFDNGLLDGQDELVFMAMDQGEEADPPAWIDDADSQTYPRYQVQVGDPLHPAEAGWVYVYRSSTLVPSTGDYVVWDAANNRLSAATYVMGLDPLTHAGTDSLELNGSGVDVLDRSKIRANVTCWIGWIPITLSLTENDLPDLNQTPTIDGRVRAGGGSITASAWFYPSLYQMRGVLNVDDLSLPQCTDVDVNWVRESDDWLNPVDVGMAPATYYDDNVPAGVPIDGVADSVPLSPADTWQQVSGARGSTVRVLDIAVGGGTISNYYKDDSAFDSGDTGDGMSFGDAGVRIDSPAGEVAIGATAFVLGAGQPNVGATYRSYCDQPLQAEATAQSYPLSCWTHLFRTKLNWAYAARPGWVKTVFSGIVRDQDHQLVAGATVFGFWTINGAAQPPQSYVTTARGQFKFPWKGPWAAPGVYAFQVTDIVLAGCSYDLGANEAPDYREVIIPPPE